MESVSGDRDAVEIDRPVRRHMRIGCDRGQGELVGQSPVAPKRDQIEVVIPREVEVRVPVGLAGAACRTRARLVSGYARGGPGIRKAARAGTDQQWGKTFGTIGR